MVSHSLRPLADAMFASAASVLGALAGRPVAPGAATQARSDASMSATAITTDGAWDAGSLVLRKKPPLIAPGVVGLLSLRLGRRDHRVVAHLRAVELRLPAERRCVERGHSLAVPGRKFEMHRRRARWPN